MKKHKRIRKAQLLSNTVATLGYLLSIASYSLLAAAIFQLSSQMAIITVPTADSVSSHGSQAGETPVVAYIVTAIVVAVALTIVVTLPYFVSKYYRGLIRRLMRLCRITSSLRAFFLVRAVVIIVPLFVFIAVTSLSQLYDMTFVVLYIATIGLVVLAEANFAIQAFLTTTLKLPHAEVW